MGKYFIKKIRSVRGPDQKKFFSIVGYNENTGSNWTREWQGRWERWEIIDLEDKVSWNIIICKNINLWEYL
jgi:hypothetical protein